MRKELPERKEASDASEQIVRVVLMNDTFTDYFHPEVLLYANDKSYSFKAEMENENVFRIGPYSTPIQVQSLERNGECPSYEGIIEIRKEDEGFLIINELPVETYLKGVLPGEMPAWYEMEALKAQAICARTYALKQIEDHRMQQFYADLDDSTGCQMYMSVPPQERTSEAVDETKNMALYSEGKLIEAYYFSTSHGRTSTDEVWEVKETSSYLNGVPCTFDSDFPWSEWSVTIPWENFQQTVCEKIPGSKVENISVQKKSQSGAVIGLLVKTDREIREIKGEYYVREILSPKDCMIHQKDGNEICGGSLLPSAYFTMDVQEGEKIEIHGGGYGHGVGMSQNGADVMAEEGYTAEEILNYFYQNIEIREADKIQACS